jgi:ribonuclease HII
MVTVGLDEVGRGCWAGPLVAGAVVLGAPVSGLKDSKLLSAKQRSSLAQLINAHALGTGLGWVSVAEVDRLGLTRAVALAMRRALQALQTPYEDIVIDGNINFFPEDSRARAIVKADNLIPAVSAASIIAKVARDTYMIKLAERFPQYGFEKHVGYGTALHCKALQTYGVSEHHRRSYKPIQALLAIPTGL